ncbi:MAG: DciA family protein [Candidatus Falkowbacteria bacterium]
MFHEIKNLLPQSIGRARMTRQVEAVNVVEEAYKIVHDRLGVDIAKQIKPFHVKNKILTIQCASSLIMQELKYREQEIVFLLNKRVGRQVVVKLRYFS